MTGEPRPGGPEILGLSSVPGFVVFDLPGVPESAGGTRLAPDVSVAEVALLARDAITSRRNVRSFTDRPIPAANPDRRPFSDVVHRGHW